MTSRVHRCSPVSCGCSGRAAFHGLPLAWVHRILVGMLRTRALDPRSLLVLSLLPVACGDDGETGLTGIGCGAGTVLVGDACVPAGGSSGGGSSDGGGGSSSDADAGSSGDGGGSSGGGSSGGGSSGGGADSSSGGAPTEIDLADVIIHDNPPDVASWPITTTITQLDFRDDGVHVVFDKQDGDGRWPDIVPPGWDGPLQYTLGLVEFIDGQWHASAAMQYWYGLEAQGGNVALDNQVAVNWYYDARWGEMAGYQPATGETIGVFVIAGNVRGVLDGSQSPVLERSDVVVVPMPGVEGASHSF